MDFLTALNKAREEGCSITRSKYRQYEHTEYENPNQWYFDDKGRLVRQSYNDEPKVCCIQNTAWDDDWCVYEGKYAKTHERIKQEKQELVELEKELNPLMQKMERLKYLQRKYSN